MLYHFFGLMGGGKSWGVVVFAYDDFLKLKRKVYANFKTSFGEYLEIKKFMDFEYENCDVILDEAYGVADSHSHMKSNDLISYVVLQSRKRDVNVFIATQNEGDLYKRIRDVANRKVLCQNLGDKENPILRYFVMDTYGNPIEALEFDTETVKSAYHLYNTYETIMPMQLNKGNFYDSIIEIFGDCPTKKSFCTVVNTENPFITKDLAETIHDLLKADKHDRVKKLLKNVG